MRTTLELPDPLFVRLKARAAHERVTLKQLLRSHEEQGLSTMPQSVAAQRSASTLPRVEAHLAVAAAQLSNAALFELLESLCRQPGVSLAAPKHDGWELFHQLQRTGDLPGRLCTDAYLTALAMANGWRLVSFDQDVERFQRLRWLQPP